VAVSPLAETAVTAEALKRPPKPKKPFLYRRSGMWLVRVVTFLIILGIWQLWAQHKQKAIAATPKEFVHAVWHQLVTDGTFFGPLWSSMEAFVLGVGLSLLIGIPIGIAMGRWHSVEHTFDPYVSFLYAIPHVAFVPIMIVWLGFRLEFRLAYVVISAVFPVIINTMTGVKAVDEQLLDAGKSFCADEKTLVRTVILPSASPYIVAGGRQAMSAAWVGVVVAEVLSTQDGLGGLINKYSDSFLTADMYVPIVGIMVIAVTIQFFAGWLQRKLTPWTNAAQREREGG
jgi:NitT/TauT family transport system permease protein